MEKSKALNITEYIDAFPAEIKEKLQQIREKIRETVPQATEVISYDMPTFKLGDDYLIHFAAYKKHIGMYPVPSGVAEFEKDLETLKTSGRGTVQFPLNKPAPLDFIGRLVLYRAAKIRERKE